MAGYKGSGLMLVKKLFAAQPAAVRETFLATLSPDERRLYDQVIATQWLPIATAASIFDKAAAALYPVDPHGVEAVGRVMARDHLAGIYKPILRMLSVSFAIQQTARLWKSYFDEGEATSAQAGSEKLGVITAVKCPGMPLTNRRIVSGYIQGLLDLCGAKSSEVVHDDSQAGKWVWTVTWE